MPGLASLLAIAAGSGATMREILLVEVAIVGSPEDPDNGSIGRA